MMDLPSSIGATLLLLAVNVLMLLGLNALGKSFDSFDIPDAVLLVIAYVLTVFQLRLLT